MRYSVGISIPRPRKRFWKIEEVNENEETNWFRLNSIVDKYSFRTRVDDNEIKITQTGDTLKLYIDQIGFGNKVGGDDASGGSLSSMTITGSGLEFDLDFMKIKIFYLHQLYLMIVISN